MDPLILKKYLNTADSNVPYDEKIDIWSLGIMCYYLFTGDTPFKVKGLNELLNEIEKGYIKIPINISAEAISFLLNMLQYSSAKRFSIKLKLFLIFNSKIFSKIIKIKIQILLFLI